MAPLPPLDSLSHAEKDALILALLARVEELCARLAELEAKLGLPPKAPDNSSTSPSQGQKASAPATGKSEGKRKPHAGAHRPLHPNPTTRRDSLSTSVQSGVGRTCAASAGAGGNSDSSKAASSRPSGKGQPRPAMRARWR